MTAPEVYVLMIDGRDYSRWYEVHTTRASAEASAVEFANADCRDDDVTPAEDYDQAVEYVADSGMGIEIEGPLTVLTWGQ